MQRGNGELTKTDIAPLARVNIGITFICMKTTAMKTVEAGSATAHEYINNSELMYTVWWNGAGWRWEIYVPHALSITAGGYGETFELAVLAAHEAAWAHDG